MLLNRRVVIEETIPVDANKSNWRKASTWWRIKMLQDERTSVREKAKLNKVNRRWIPYHERRVNWNTVEMSPKDGKSTVYSRKFWYRLSTPRHVLVKMLTSYQGESLSRHLGRRNKLLPRRRNIRLASGFPATIISVEEQWSNAHKASSEGKKTWPKNLTRKRNILQGWRKWADILKQGRILGLKHPWTFLENSTWLKNGTKRLIEIITQEWRSCVIFTKGECRFH